MVTDRLRPAGAAVWCLEVVTRAHTGREFFGYFLSIQKVARLVLRKKNMMKILLIL
jgi:hypothetical protein